MRTRAVSWLRRALLVAACGTLTQVGCLGTMQRELDLLWSPEANLGYFRNSFLVDWFGAGILQFW